MLFPFFFSCGNKEQVLLVDELPPIYPDYANITIPYNIAPLNFILRNEAQRIETTLKGQSGSITFSGKEKMQFSEKRWKKFLSIEKGNSITVEVKAKITGQWIEYKPFEWIVSEDAIDPYLTYRLIEPGYEVWNKIQLCERNVETFSVKVFADNNLTDDACMNCHITGNQDPRLSFFHVRGEKGGTILNRDGQLRKIKAHTEKMFAPPIYGNLHPSGRYGVFSTNKVIPQFHTLSSTKLEVYDSASDQIGRAHV